MDLDVTIAQDNTASQERIALVADRIIRNHMIAAMASGVIPLPLVADIVAVTCIEVHMITALARLYAFPVPDKIVLYKVMISLAGGIGPAILSSKLENWVRGLPIVVATLTEMDSPVERNLGWGPTPALRTPMGTG